LQLKVLNTRCNLLLIALIFAAGLFSCRPARHVSENQYLLDRYKVTLPASEIDRNELKDYVRQKPNKRILGIRFHLWLHNLANPEKNGWPHNWLRRIGEEPVIFDPFLAQRSVSQIEQYLRTKGYYHAVVEDSVRIRNNRVRLITYRVEPRRAYRIASVSYTFNDAGLRSFILEDSVNSLVKPGNLFDLQLLNQEMLRIESYLKNRGYFFFSNREHIHFEADTTSGNMEVDIDIIIRSFRERTPDGQLTFRPHRQYKIGNVFIFPSYNPREALDRPDDYFSGSDTLLFRDMFYIFRDRLPVSERTIAQSNFIQPGNLFNQESVDRTYRHLFALRQYRLVNIRFSEPTDLSASLQGRLMSGREGSSFPGQNDTTSGPVAPNPGHYQTAVPEPGLQPATGQDSFLDAWIQLTPFNMQSFTIEMEGTNSSGDFGFGGSLLYQHRNVFGKAEILDFRLKGSVETLNEYYSRSYRNTYEYGAEAGLQIPRFLLPIRSISFVRRYNPRTNLNLAYSFQRRPDYTRTIANSSFGYSWRASDYHTHIINPIELKLVRLPFATPLFDSIITNYNLQASFRDHLVSETNYTFIFNNQDIRIPRDFVYFRFNTETAGNILNAASYMANRPRSSGHYRLFGTEIAQYFKSDIDFRYYRMLYGGNSLVYRLFAGAGVPYGNSAALPFEKKYFAGGANSIRAWQVRSLGPGSFHEATDRSFPNRTADIKLEANIEYRFDMFWLLEGALFMDAGNIWAIDDNDKREGALFNPATFYRDIALGTGIGFRFDFSFFIFRMDIGLKLRDPSEPLNKRWIHLHRGLNLGNDIAFNVGIGYPF
jgi:outer membrane protein assembly factor BamA